MSGERTVEYWAVSAIIFLYLFGTITGAVWAFVVGGWCRAASVVLSAVLVTWVVLIKAREADEIEEQTLEWARAYREEHRRAACDGSTITTKGCEDG